MTASAAAGFNAATLNTTNVTGNVTMNAGLNNTRDVAGVAIAPTAGLDVAGNDILLEGAQVVESDIGGTVNMTATNGSNTAAINLANVNNNVTMLAGLSNNLSAAGIVINALVGNNGAGNDYLMSPTLVSENLINGAVSMTATNGSNAATLSLTDVNNNITMNAGNTNSLTVDGVEINPVTGQNALGYDILLAAAQVVESVVTGAVAMTSVNGNGAAFQNANVTGTVTMTATASGNTLNVNSNVIAPVFGTNATGDILVSATMVDPSTIGGAVLMTATGDNNSATFDNANALSTVTIHS